LFCKKKLFTEVRLFVFFQGDAQVTASKEHYAFVAKQRSEQDSTLGIKPSYGSRLFRRFSLVLEISLGVKESSTGHPLEGEATLRRQSLRSEPRG